MSTQTCCAKNITGTVVIFSVLGSATLAPQPASAEPFCPSCEVRIGLGGTYHYWGGTDGVVLPLTVSWSDNRYEVGIFRMATAQRLMKSDASSPERVASPYWGVSASRRWLLLDRGPVRAFFGFGLAYRAESDILSVTHLNFASQIALHARLPGSGSTVELSLRHWSNGGVRLPNHGQDFAALTFRLDPRYFTTVRRAGGQIRRRLSRHEGYSAMLACSSARVRMSFSMTSGCRNASV